MEFGTGAVKITPAHDPNNYEVGVRHKLEFINILNDDGTFNWNAGEKFKGMKRFHASRAVVEALKELGLYIEQKDNPMTVPICSKSGDIIEPVMKPQWWVNCGPLAEEAIKRTRAGELLITPKSSEAEWYRWLEGIQDWCISRQMWWGHRCPAYLVDIKGTEQDKNDGKWWVVGRTEQEATERATKLAAGAKFTIHQDEDVLDTWFSSGLWPFSILGWPKETSNLKDFYPSSMLETGWDILFFWVARMVLLGIKLTGKVPFKEVFCHAMVRDAHGRKMSKSLGNVIDPVDVIEGITLERLQQKLTEGNFDEREILKAQAGQKKDFPKGIPQCGTDALRFALCAYTSGGRDINLEILRVEGYCKFCNKLWNATKFAMLKLDDAFVPEASPKLTGRETIVEKWILHKLDMAAANTIKALEERNFMAATTAVYNFWLYELCDVFIPMTDEGASADVRKSAQNTLYTCLDSGLRLLHPFMPFVTEELWQRLPRWPNDPTPSIMVSKYPVQDNAFANPAAEKDFNKVFNVIRQSSVPVVFFNKNWAVFVSSTASDEAEMIFPNADDFFPDQGLQGMVNLDAEVAKLDKKLGLAKMSAEKIRKLQEQADYEKNLPENVRAANAEKLATLDAEITILEQSIDMFSKLK
ncbi:hypothetical protein FRC07_011685 [Ceratobasidium sp. 392]|nr:hypothetical protein FRC07_011685 [Ceratobasidium sp. 392]